MRRPLACIATTCLLLVSCGSDDEAALSTPSFAVTSAATTTPVPVATEVDTSEAATATSGPVAATTLASFASDVDSSPEQTLPPTTVASLSPSATTTTLSPPAFVDPVTGLAVGTRTATPGGVVAPSTFKAAGSLIIDAGAWSIVAPIGTCSDIDGTTYVAVSDSAGASAVLLFTTASRTGASLTWQVSSGLSASADPDGFVLAIDPNGSSGTFSGTVREPKPPLDPSQTSLAFSGVEPISPPSPLASLIPLTPVIPLIPPPPVPMAGSFSCTAVPFGISGDRPVTLPTVRCDIDGGLVSSGDLGDAALLALDPSTLTPDGAFQGALSWRVSGVGFRTRWLTGALSADRMSATFIGLAIAPNDTTFTVSGGFSCPPS